MMSSMRCSLFDAQYIVTEAANLMHADEERKDAKQDSTQHVRSFASSPLASSLHHQSPLPAQRSMPFLPRRPFTSPLLPHQSTTPSSSSTSLQAKRSLNSWTPAQRYFVEGDHVIAAEVGRTFQFTGLDSGSFYPFVVYTAVATVIATAFMVIPWIIAPQRVDLDKSSAYECGFDAFGEARQTFSVSFYLVSIMYLLFDIEICYLFPYVMCQVRYP